MHQICSDLSDIFLDNGQKLPISLIFYLLTAEVLKLGQYVSNSNYVWRLITSVFIKFEMDWVIFSRYWPETYDRWEAVTNMDGRTMMLTFLMSRPDFADGDNDKLHESILTFKWGLRKVSGQTLLQIHKPSEMCTLYKKPASMKYIIEISSEVRQQSEHRSIPFLPSL